MTNASIGQSPNRIIFPRPWQIIIHSPTSIPAYLKCLENGGNILRVVFALKCVGRFELLGISRLAFLASCFFIVHHIFWLDEEEEEDFSDRRGGARKERWKENISDREWAVDEQVEYMYQVWNDLCALNFEVQLNPAITDVKEPINFIYYI